MHIKASREYQQARAGYVALILPLASFFLPASEPERSGCPSAQLVMALLQGRAPGIAG